MEARKYTPSFTESVTNGYEKNKRKWRFQRVYLEETRERSYGQGRLPSSTKNLHESRNHKFTCQSITDVIISFMQEEILIQGVNCSRAYIYWGTYICNSRIQLSRMPMESTLTTCRSTPRNYLNHFLFIDLLTANPFAKGQIEYIWPTTVWTLNNFFTIIYKVQIKNYN